MHPAAQHTAGIVGVATADGLAAWAAARLLGIDLDVRMNGDLRQVGPADVVLATVVAGLAAWVVYSVMARGPRTSAGGRSGATLIWGFASAPALRGRVGAPGR
jgi:Family of unknown function (DUF6069)